MQFIRKMLVVLMSVLAIVAVSAVPASAAPGLKTIIVAAGNVTLTPSGQYYTCKQYIASPQGVTLAGWSIEPRIQWLETIKLPRKWVDRQWPLRDGWTYPTKKIWQTAGGTASASEKKSHRNAKISRLINGDTNRPSNPWNFSRKRSRGPETVRCIAIYNFTANRITGYHPVSGRPIWGDHRSGVMPGQPRSF